MSPRFLTAGVIAALTLPVTSSRAVEPPAPAAAAQEPRRLSVPELAFTKYQLDNGLTVILHRDPSLPLVAVNLWYHVGPVNEPPKRSGFAHLFEHLMFEGSRHVGREFDVLLESVGATNVNGTTNWDRTNYFETVPREHLELVLWIESDRMGFMLDGLNEERLEIQRDVVKNERRQSYENAPYGPSTLALLNSLFPEGHPYHGAVIGSMEDLSRASLADVREFFQAYYAPSNATLVLAGDFDTDGAKALIERYFGTLPNRKRPELARPGYKPLDKPVRLVIDEPVDLAQVSLGWRTPPAYTKDDPVLDVAMALLAGGKATRLYRTLVVDKKLAADVSAGLDSNRLASFATVSATVASGKSVDQVERELDAVLAELQQSGPSAVELERAKSRILLGVLSNLELLNGPGGESGRAGLLQRFDHYTSDPGYLNKWLEQVERVSAADVQRVLAEHLKSNARVTVITQPRTAAAPAPGASKGASK
jgi:zinc protease